MSLEQKSLFQLTTLSDELDPKAPQYVAIGYLGFLYRESKEWVRVDTI